MALLSICKLAYRKLMPSKSKPHDKKEVTKTSISDVCGLEGTKIDDGSRRMSDGFYESEFGRRNHR